MWRLVNRTRFAAERSFARDRGGAELLLVVVKATYRIAEDGSLRLADEQQPVLHAPVFAAAPESSPLLHEADFRLSTAGTDVLLHGTAYAREGRPTVALEASLRVGPLSKTIAVIGDRVWQRRGAGLERSEPEPFASMPLSYERAYGGADGDAFHPDNPVGTGFASTPDNLVGKRAPNLERSGALVPRPDERPQPVSFGPIARSWQPRLARAGTFDAAWEAQTMPLLPLDYDARHERSAPDDQQLASYLEGGEPIELEQLTPAGRLALRLPRVRIAMRTWIGRSVVRHAPLLHTLTIEPDASRLTLCWQSNVPCHRKLYALRGTVVEEVADG